MQKDLHFFNQLKVESNWNAKSNVIKTKWILECWKSGHLFHFECFVS